jgi:hypothetical protein
MTRSDGVAALFIGFLTGIVVCMVFVSIIPRITPDDLIAAHVKGQRDALKTNPASESLERVCAGLWMDQQKVR